MARESGSRLTFPAACHSAMADRRALRKLPAPGLPTRGTNVSWVLGMRDSRTYSAKARKDRPDDPGLVSAWVEGAINLLTYVLIACAVGLLIYVGALNEATKQAFAVPRVKSQHWLSL